MIKLYDSSKKEKSIFEPLEKNKVKIYVCGPTVYDSSHLGHARSAIAFDILHRVFKINNYQVTMVKNFTDIDDKIIKKIKQSKISLEEITTKYINEYKNDMKNLNILPNTLEPKATQNIDNMISMIQILLEKEYAYITQNGVYFNTSKHNQYGKLSNKNDTNNQSRIIIDENKKNKKDFALWKLEDKNGLGYNSSFGYGRPGWHIECSAMIDKHLNKDKNSTHSIDIHGGGADLLFPHHENEEAQSICATNKPLAKYWIHNGFVNIDGEKMSKSLGNSFYLKDILKIYDPEIIRYYTLCTHYRKDLNFNEQDILSSKKRLDKLYRIKKLIYDIKESINDKEFEDKIKSSLNDDLNSVKALSIIDELITSSNDILTNEPKNKTIKKQLLSNILFLNQSLGIGYQDPYKYFQFGIKDDELIMINDLILKRTQAKQKKEFSKADKYRDELKNMNINIMDTQNGTVWEKI